MINILENFLKMEPEVPQYSPKNQHFLIAGANPTYYLEETGTQEEQVASLTASLDWIQNLGIIIEGDIVHMIASTEGTFAIYFVTDTTKVYGATQNTIIDLGYPTGVAINNAGGRLACSDGLLLFTLPTLPRIYKMTMPSSVWTSFGVLNTSSGIHFLEPFLDYVAVTDGTTTTNNLIKKADTTSFLITSGIDIGRGWGVVQMRNYNNKYLAIAAGQTLTTSFVYGYVQNYIFLWDGISDRYNYSVKIPGRFIDMKVIDSVLYVAVLTSSSKTVLYYLAGTALKKIKTFQISSISQAPFPVPAPLFTYNNNVGVHLQAVSNSTFSLQDPLLVMGKDESGSSEFILSYGRRFQQFTIGFDGFLYGHVSDSGSTLWYYPVFGNSYQKIQYVSQWIPCRNVTAIDVYYDTPPVGFTDKISTTIYGRGEDIQSGISTTVLMDITPSSILNTTRTRLDIQGFTGSKIRVSLQTTNSGTWRPNIRQVVLLDDRIK